MKFLKYQLIVILAVCFLASCLEKKVTFNVTRSSQLPIDNIKSVAIGEFTDVLGQKIPLPKEVKKEAVGDKGIKTFTSNQKVAELVRSMLISEISRGGQYRIVNSSGGETSYSGAIPDESTVGVINAKIKYYEFTKEGNDKKFFVLLVTNNTAIGQLPMMQRLAAEGLKIAAVKGAESSKKGFEVAVPYVERIAALEVDFDFIRKSNGEKLIPTQTFRSYFTKKWGGEEDNSILSEAVQEAILEHYDFSKSAVMELANQAEKAALLLRDEEEYIARGYFLKSNPKVPLLPLDLRQMLGKRVALDFTKKISRYHEETSLSVASGDAIGVTLINGNAYDKAIGHLESLPKPLSSDDTYNLALAYESMGEYAQALNYYEKGFEETQNDKFKAGIDRVKQ